MTTTTAGPARVGDVVRVTYTHRTTGQLSAVMGLVEAVDAAANTATVFVGNRQSWNVPMASVTRVGLPTVLPWTPADTQKLRSAAASSPSSPSAKATTTTATAAAGATSPTATKQAVLSSSPAASPAAVAGPSRADATKNAEAVHPAPLSLPILSSSSFHNLDSADAEPATPYSNVLYELNARLTGLCAWSSPPLTGCFLTVLYLWLAVESTGALTPKESSDNTTFNASFVLQCGAVAVVRTLLAVVLCSCVSMSPRQIPTSTFWLIFPLMVVSLGGSIPVSWWHGLVLGCLPVRLPSEGSAGGSATAVPLLFWLVKLLIDGVRGIVRRPRGDTGSAAAATPRSQAEKRQ